MPAAEPGNLALADLMADMAPVWDRIVQEHGLDPTPYDRMALWLYGDFVFAPDYDILSDITKIRLHGFHVTIDTEAMYLDLLGRYRSARLIP